MPFESIVVDYGLTLRPLQIPPFNSLLLTGVSGGPSTSAPVILQGCHCSHPASFLKKSEALFDVVFLSSQFSPYGPLYPTPQDLS